MQVDVSDAAGKPLADAVVFLDSAEARKQVKPLAGVEMAQEKRQFVPGVLVVPVGTEVRFPNHDTVRHHCVLLLARQEVRAQALQRHAVQPLAV